MAVPPKITTFFGARFAAAPKPLCIPRDPDAAAAFAARADAAADRALQAGRVRLAESLAHAAYEARCRAEART